MTPEQKAAFVIAQAVEAFGTMAGMVAENAFHINSGGTPIHSVKDFQKVTEDKGLYHNALITFFQD